MAPSKFVVNPINIAFALSPRVLRIPEAAAWLATTPFFVEELLRDGILPFRVVGKARVVEVSDLNAYLESIPKQSGALPGRGRFLATKAMAS
jgi:excisionase family DNA binding protein